jgi:hypothetical protein
MRRCATSRQVAGLIPGGVIGIIYWLNPSDRSVALWTTQPLIWGVPIRAHDLKRASKEQERASRVAGDICRILCSTVTRSVSALYWNKNISTFWINGAFITKLNVALLLGHPVETSTSGISWERVQEGQVRRPDNLTTFMCRLSRNSRSLSGVHSYSFSTFYILTFWRRNFVF